MSGIELSQPMIDQLRQKATAEELPVVQGDMTVTTVPGGRFVVELGVPSRRRFPPGQTAVPFDVTEEHTGLATLDRSRTGLEHEQRVADWHGSPFTAESECHVSVWRKR